MIETHLHRSRQTIKLGLIRTMKELFPGEELKTAYSIQEGVFCRLNTSDLSVREVRLIHDRMQEWVAANPSIEYLGHVDGFYRYHTGGMDIRMVYPCETHLEDIPPFGIIPYGHGFIVDFGDVGAGGMKPLIPPDMLSATYHETQKWLRKLDIELIEDVNRYVAKGDHNHLIALAEALHEKEFAAIADKILQQRRALRVLLISGPSSAGKTSFAHRLSTQLRVSGLKPVPISLDDYFLNEEDKPIGEDGKADWECLHAIDLPHLQQQIKELIQGEVVDTPIYDFTTGSRLAASRRIRLADDEILVIEGIHAMNPELLPNINRNSQFKVYISALFELNIDLVNRIPASELRLIRRLVRGDRYRGTDPEVTLDQWASVRKGEFQNIFKFQEECDVMFNSSLLYELNALRQYAEHSLMKIRDDSPYVETRDRLLNLLGFCEPMDTSKIPFNSILREFIGGSIYFE